MTVTQAQIDARVANPEHRSLDAVQSSIQRLDFDAAAAGLLARAKRGEPLPGGLVSQVVPRMHDHTVGVLLVLLADGDRGGTVATLLETDSFPDDDRGTFMAIACAIAAIAVEGGVRQRVAVPARILANATRAAGAAAGPVHHALHALARSLGDDAFARTLPQVVGPPPGAIALAEAMACMSREQLLATVDRTFNEAHAREVAAAERKQLGRNEPCWCASGKKFKRCHGAEELPAREVRPAHLLDLDDVQRMSLPELAVVRFAQLGDSQLAATVQRLLKYRVWDVAELALGELVTRDHLSLEVRDGTRIYFLVRALRCRQFHLVPNQLAAVSTRRFAAIKETVSLALAMAQRSPDALERFLAFTERAVRDPSALLLANLAETLCSLVPAIGLLLVRAAVASDVIETQRDQMFHIAEEARARLLLDPGEPSQSMFAAWKQAKGERRDHDEHERRHAEATAEQERLRASVVEANRRMREAERRAGDLEQLLRDQQAARAVAERQAEPAELRALREKIEGLQAAIRDKNAELVELRRKATATGDATSAAPQTAAVGPQTNGHNTDEHDDGWDDMDAIDRKIVASTWRDAALADLQVVPAHVAREALRTAAELGGGEPAAWRAVKRAKRIPMLMCRIGLQHRLLFRTSTVGLEIVELVSRQSLDQALKRHA